MAENDDVIVRIQPVKNKGGVWVQMGMEEYRIPPLGFGAIQELQERLGSLRGMTDMPTEDQMKTVAEIVQMAMKRNYPDITVEDVFDKLDLGNFRPVFEAVLSMNGYRSAKPGEAQTTSR